MISSKGGGKRGDQSWTRESTVQCGKVEGARECAWVSWSEDLPARVKALLEAALCLSKVAARVAVRAVVVDGDERGRVQASQDPAPHVQHLEEVFPGLVHAVSRLEQ